MLRRRVKNALKRRFPVLVTVRDALRGEPKATAQEAEVEVAPAPVAAPAVAPAPIPSAAPVQPAAKAFTSPEGMTVERLEAVLDDMVRPALRMDGGDIELVALQGADVHVRLVGACNGCPSSTMTLRMGVENLLREEFPAMGDLVQVDASPYGL